jgi:hypothetical protein
MKAQSTLIHRDSNTVLANIYPLNGTGGSSNLGPCSTSSTVASSSLGGGPGVGSSSGSASVSAGGGNSAEALASSVSTAMSDEPMITTTSTAASSTATSAAKRAFDSDSGQVEEQDEEGRKRKKKDPEPGKDNTGGAKGTASSRQAAGRNNPAIAEKVSAEKTDVNRDNEVMSIVFKRRFSFAKLNEVTNGLPLIAFPSDFNKVTRVVRAVRAVRAVRYCSSGGVNGSSISSALNVVALISNRIFLDISRAC